MRRIIVLTGNGKGKTTSAIGTATRALGRGYKVFFYQFMKSMDVDYGEHLFFKGRGLDMIRLGHGCNKDFKYGPKDAIAATNGLKRIMDEIPSNNQTLVILDEISYPMMYNWFHVQDVIALLNRFKDTNFILTGRDMPKELIDIADTVSSVDEVKHIYQKGQIAQQGIEL